ncbi:uncharacterized protein BO88DRAFT_407552 [Aspergillus vadensis CBS 113365]|uniref:Uncharacterized protein n=1 Tax=Aspergillus vadensis (strain CBS 113365 / IMI 142717 / IBT 24658) TaxID=1448311 RepID=A0A319B0J3_ASPVC|nr:hypothetical protein BO88DRAFT_407552 [Aspergillus vadensis CBS 113365]PYH65354.1 hypothetical protein BO88DRAFT_407552 [Aspergillus vadensis CBS 113365]
MPQPRLLAKPTFPEPRQMTPTLASLDCSYSSSVTVLQERYPNLLNLSMIVMIDNSGGESAVSHSDSDYSCS